VLPFFRKRRVRLLSGRVFILGIDGGEFAVIDYLISSGELPSLKGLMSEGIRRPLMSTTPPLTPAAWATFYTGTNPGRHGVLDFLIRREGKYSMIPVHRSMVSGRTLWEEVSRAGLKALIINVPVTYPPDAVDGWMISGMDTPGPNNRYFHPPELQEEILGLFPGYQPDVHVSRHQLKYSRELASWYIDQVIDLLESRISVILHLTRQKSWDLAVAVLTAADRLQHVFWEEVEEAMSRGTIPGPEEPAGAVFEAYRATDRLVGNLTSSLGGEDHLMVISDHGFGPLDRDVNLNVLLARLGYLSFKPAPLLPDLARRMTGGLKTSLPRGVRDLLRKLLPAPLARPLEGLSILEEVVDWERTRAYAMGYKGGVYLNLEGREPRGTVPPGEYRKTLDELSARLASFPDPEDGSPLITAIDRRDDLYRGPQASRLPDLILTIKDHRCTTRHSFSGAGEELFSKPQKEFGSLSHTGSHRPEGIFIGRGAHLREDRVPESPGIIDICPTVLELLELETPSALDGTSFATEKAPRGVPGGGETSPHSPPGSSSLTAEEEEEVLDNLRDLGYL
jgi:predicted AlkP superfamily phosphohydrolase/phosphomutase